MSHDKEKYPTSENKDTISLRDLLTYDNPNLTRYRSLIAENFAESHGIFPTTSFAELWTKIYYNDHGQDHEKFSPPQWEKIRLYFADKLRDNVLIDVGGGDGAVMSELAQKCRVETYINIDAYGFISPVNPLEGRLISNRDLWQKIPEQERTHPIKQVEVDTDMLDFIARLPNDSSNFAINGIDAFVINDENYLKALINELIRATKNGGIIFGTESKIHIDDPKFKNMTRELGLDNRYFVFEKNE